SACRGTRAPWFDRLGEEEPPFKTQVTVLERTREAGKKILMSGGSRWYVVKYPVGFFCWNVVFCCGFGVFLSLSFLWREAVWLFSAFGGGGVAPRLSRWSE
ncbi:hypothetical protein Agub_g2362, partial [Astrephomene gubernaculifera]